LRWNGTKSLFALSRKPLLSIAALLDTRDSNSPRFSRITH